ncbi:hypothetical protein AbraIFM66951_010155 [Aspergillus brasiliensis]|uniref:SMODS and SLOG-associating 2TM effector domain-containing protein n=1 Tax=Aspergillus brasiliensis TaxID=319629 RepID=A0A9W6DN59_9EURO|nr:hypothetical protein AbraCBS73388_007044 [Aspergillus brasiliensis]GKZ46982.1 hypothetical protein AbraIFM66951_010155 [Aspergillus brasiliensis]
MVVPNRRPNFARRLLHAALDREEQGLPPMPQGHSHHTNPPYDIPIPNGSASTMPAPSPPTNIPTHGAMPPPTHTPANKHPLTISTTQASSLIPPQDKLLVFRALTGIDSIPALNTLHHFSRTAPNIGIYTRVVRAEQSAAARYRFFSILINVCLGIQIVVAAALTALGAASGPHSAVTAFGAINTIMAGVLTYLKGSGLPDRLKHYQNEWRNIREYIEQRERELCLAGCSLDIQDEIQFIEYMYEGVKREIEATKSGENRSNAREGLNRRAFLPRQGSQVQQHPQAEGHNYGYGQQPQAYPQPYPQSYPQGQGQGQGQAQSYPHDPRMASPVRSPEPVMLEKTH